MVSNQYIGNMLNELPHFRGCVACDKLLEIKIEKNKKHQFVINTGISTSPGEHFVYLEITPHKNPIFIDSFGLPITNNFIESFLIENGYK